MKPLTKLLLVHQGRIIILVAGNVRKFAFEDTPRLDNPALLGTLSLHKMIGEGILPPWNSINREGSIICTPEMAAHGSHINVSCCVLCLCPDSGTQKVSR